MIICKTPFRVSFFGGGTDLPSWLKNNNGHVISTSINKYGYILFRQSNGISNAKFTIRYYLNEQTNNINKVKHPVVRECLKYYKMTNKYLNITYDGDLPSRSGLGSSSSFSVGLINSIYNLKNKRINKSSLAKEAINFEHKILREYVGYQDQIATSYGGFNHIFFKKKKFEVKKIKTQNWISDLLNEQMLICLIDGKRSAANIEKKKIGKISKNYQIYSEIFDITSEAKLLLKCNKYNSINKFGALLNDYWNLKRKLDASVSNKKIDYYCKKFLNYGAYGSKLMGAGHSGFILIIAESNVRDKLIKSFPNLKFVKIKGENKGSHIIFPN